METHKTITQEPVTDVMEVCTILQCLGWSVKSSVTTGIGCSQDTGVKTVTINCQSSGLQVVLESENANCSCPVEDLQASGLWQDSGIPEGKQIYQETGSALLVTLPNVYRERVARKLREIVKGIKENNDTDSEGPRQETLSKSVSTGDLNTAEMSDVEVSVDSLTRSLDTSAKDECALLPAPGPLQPALNMPAEERDEKKSSRTSRRRTYIISSPVILPRIGPMQDLPSSSVLDNLIAAAKKVEDLREGMAMMIKELNDAHGGISDSLTPDVSFEVLAHGGISDSTSTLTTDVSFEGPKGNLSGFDKNKETSNSKMNLFKMPQEKEGKIAKLKRSMSHNKKSTDVKDEGKIAKLKRSLSHNMFRMKKSADVKDKESGQQKHSKC